MSKRVLSVQNQDQPQRSSIITRSSAKRTSTNETISTKKTKLDKENIPEKETEPEPKIVSPPIINPTVDNTEKEQEEEEEEEEINYPISVIADDENGKDYPTNKQYLIYENTKSNKEPYIISKTARYWSQKYRKVLCHVHPDAYRMYIHNDFSAYGELEVIENCLLDLTKTIFIVQEGIFNYMRKDDDKVNYILGFRRLEVLTILLDYTDGISGIDDGERFYEIIRVIGACYVTILHGLLPKIMFEKITNIDENLVKKLNKISKQIPNFKHVLEQALIIGHSFLTIADVCSAYTKILQV